MVHNRTKRLSLLRGGFVKTFIIILRLGARVESAFGFSYLEVASISPGASHTPAGAVFPTGEAHDASPPGFATRTGATCDFRLGAPRGGAHYARLPTAGAVALAPRRVRGDLSCPLGRSPGLGGRL